MTKSLLVDVALHLHYRFYAPNNETTFKYLEGGRWYLGAGTETATLRGYFSFDRENQGNYSCGAYLTPYYEHQPVQHSETVRSNNSVNLFTGEYNDCITIDSLSSAPRICSTVSGGPVAPTTGQSHTLTCSVTGTDCFSAIITYRWMKFNGTRVQVMLLC